ncbi:MAG: hypothetical protein VB133_09355 [Anaeromusa sp.]|uniref:hypothetical protein n=1 Tax=Anaeromusa sp. TaxID=1872520 RepID=UPI002B20E677|nr:hypothetical protein [Anaeromusa sp.]MEA4835329.1 hypothetical protein [Anaeromusa sp.]
MDVSFVQNAGDILQLAMMMLDRSPKQLAAEIGCTVDVIYNSCIGTRAVPAKLRKKVAGSSLLAAMAVGMEATGLKWLFGLQGKDHHQQTTVVRAKKATRFTTAMLEELEELLLDKEKKEDLSSDEYARLRELSMDVMCQANSLLHLGAILDAQYRLNLAAEMQKEKRPLGAGTPSSPSINQQSNYIIKKTFRQRGVTP